MRHPMSRIAPRARGAATLASVVLVLLIVPALAGCSSHTAPPKGEISGRLVAVGGPAPGLPRPLPGHVTVNGPSGKVTTVAVTSNGQFRLELPVGTYTLIGHSPYYGSNEYVCHGARTAVVGSSQFVAVDVVCSEY
jgi:hypothetical protein